VFKPRPAPLTKLAAAPLSSSVAGNIVQNCPQLSTAAEDHLYMMIQDYASIDCFVMVTPSCINAAAPDMASCLGWHGDTAVGITSGSLAQSDNNVTATYV
jgi:hypothetical protein